MKIKILPSASQDLIDGYWFYEKQSPGLGSYFKDTLFSDIDSLVFFGGILQIFYDKYHR
ncbi:MAG: type II toxin-antitoxin system RelE/ParE family toxin, partial [Spirochaetes bacterium]